MKSLLRRIVTFVTRTVPTRVRLLALRMWYVNRPYREYYRAVMRHRASRDPKTAVGGQWEVMGPHQCAFLKSRGLQPHHVLLDIGCGSLRGGLHFIEYLETGHYYGIDISPDIIAEGKRFLHEQGLDHKQPHLSVNRDLTFAQFEGQTFDFLNAQSVLSHMPKEDITELFAHVPKVMHATSVFYATFFEDDTYHSSADAQNFHYPFAMLVDMGAAQGLIIERVDDTGFARKQHIMKISRASQ